MYLRYRVVVVISEPRLTEVVEDAPRYRRMCSYLHELHRLSLSPDSNISSKRVKARNCLRLYLQLNRPNEMAEELAQLGKKTLYCMICGLQTAAYDQSEISHDWIHNVVLLRDPDDEIGSISPSLTKENLLRRTEIYQCEAQTKGFRPRSEASPIEVTPAFANWPGYYRTSKEGAQNFNVMVFCKNRYSPGYTNVSTEHHLPVHQACLELAQRLWKTSPETAYINDMRGLFLALAWRYTLGVKSHEMKAYSYPPNYRMADDFHLRWVVWKHKEKNQEGPTDDLKVKQESPMLDDNNFWGPNPADSMDVTSFVCENLDQTPRRQATRFKTLLYELPPELRASILNRIAFRDLPQVTTGLLPQSFWLNHLKSGRALPWLFELKDKAHLLDEKAAEPCPGGDAFEWNWELLTRKLTRSVDFGVGDDVPTGTNPYEPVVKDSVVVRSEETFWQIHGYHNDLKDVPAGLLNRRRTWQLLEEMFVGDYLPQADTTNILCNYIGPHWVIERFIQLPWAKSGRLLKIPKWIPSVNFEPYVRRANGEVYTRSDTEAPLQYWQDPGGYWKRNRLTSCDESPAHFNGRRPPRPATAEDVFRVLRRLGYPV